ncbi:pescadillo homolog [Plakobranchus ocellatus]|uniref:Pescadillo homolog n=1 Tax=Plakobranchus ocellatus TaxID=259542 RepID=A0AAV4DQT2_9GAST|nr:pescadillo homolog [Plakobranchus ocellatus]
MPSSMSGPNVPLEALGVTTSFKNRSWSKYCQRFELASAASPERAVVLQAVVDANYKFITIDVGGYGKQSDGGTFQVSDFYRALETGKFESPEPADLPQTTVKAPFVFVADEAYPLLPFLLKPYSGTCLPYEQENFNKRLSRCRKTVECAFGILTSKWRLLNNPIETKTELVYSIIKCVCVLHNAIVDREGMERNLTGVSFPDRGVIWGRIGRPSNDAKSKVSKNYLPRTLQIIP